MSRADLTIPDIGNFSDVTIVDVLVKTGDVVEVDSPLVTLETDKASMDVPATVAGTITEVLLKRGDKVSKGSLIARVECGAQGTAGAPVTASAPAAAAPSQATTGAAVSSAPEPAATPTPATTAYLPGADLPPMFSEAPTPRD